MEDSMSVLREMTVATDCFKDGPQSGLERVLLEEFLRGKGYRLSDLDRLPEEEAKALMIEACRYASLKLAQLESTARFREEIRRPD
jgi:hypothetical protein